MKKSSKAVLAAGAAVVVLTGGAGSLAYWNATADVGGGTVDSGNLALTPIAGGGWEFNGAPIANPGTVVIVPGDELSYSGTYTVNAVGDNVQATVAVTGGGEGGTLAPYVDTELVSTVGGATVTTVNEDNDGDTLAVDLTVDFPFGTTVDNASKVKRLNLADIAIVLTQTDATP